MGGLPLLAREAERIAAGRAAGVGHEDLDRPELLPHTFHEPGRRVEVERVVLERDRADLRGGGFERFRAAGAEGNTGTLRGELPGDAEADAARAARD